MPPTDGHHRQTLTPRTRLAVSFLGLPRWTESSATTATAMWVNNHGPVGRINSAACQQSGDNSQATENFHGKRSVFKMRAVYCCSRTRGHSGCYKPYDEHPHEHVEINRKRDSSTWWIKIRSAQAAKELDALPGTTHGLRRSKVQTRRQGPRQEPCQRSAQSGSWRDVNSGRLLLCIPFQTGSLHLQGVQHTLCVLAVGRFS